MRRMHVSKNHLSRQSAVFAREGVLLLLAVLTLLTSPACGPRQNSFQIKELEALDTQPGSDIDPRFFDRYTPPPAKTTAPKTSAVPPQAKASGQTRTLAPPPASAPASVPAPAPVSVLPKNNDQSNTQSIRPKTGQGDTPNGGAAGSPPATTAAVPIPVPRPDIAPENEVIPADRTEEDIAKIRTRSTPGNVFDSMGRPRRSYDKRLSERFGDRLNHAIAKDKLSNADQIKYQKIFREIQRAVDRTKKVESDLMFMDSSSAIDKSKKFEDSGEVSREGAWSIAVEATAKRHGFENVPCAEFMSEIVREAYARAGYAIEEDFNKDKGNKLIWSETASVTGLSRALYKAGWVPFSAHLFRPPVGAILFHTVGISPSHAYAAAGMDGLMIVDNGRPKGRDLRQSKAKTLNLMFSTGFFMLPPGITPARWPDPSVPTS